MKKILLILIGLIILAGLIYSFLFSTISWTQLTASNLIPNPSVEKSNILSKQPLKWQSEKWGDNSVSFEYKANNTHWGKKGLSISVNQYNSGDAKWYFQSIKVKKNTIYTFSNFYKSSVNTETIAALTDTSGKISFIYLGQNNPSDKWVKSVYTVVTREDTKRLSIYHVINQEGFLITDDYNLVKSSRKFYTNELPIIANYVPNSSFEKPSDKVSFPQAWQPSTWGKNVAKFEYSNTGFTGKRSVKTTITEYEAGDAKWSYEPQSILPGDYQFTDYYKSNIPSEIVVAVNGTDKDINYISLKPADPSENWIKYSDYFTLPQGTQKITVYHLIKEVGYLETDDFAIQPANPEGFQRGMVTLTFDDGFETMYYNALPLMQRYGIKSTQYLISENIGKPTYMSADQIKTMQKKGHEIGSHSATHADSTKIGNAELEDEITGSKKELVNSFKSINNYSTPFGLYDEKTIGLLKLNYRSNRVSDLGYNNKANFDQYKIKVQYLHNKTSAKQIKQWAFEAKRDKVWLVLLYHSIDDSGSEYSTTPDNFEKELSFIKNSGLAVKTMNQALDELIPQTK